ncbi:hypothetical protein BDZ91DRAFT_808114 [Kalaharituber pfeilii]|nr:hypothetical protein BDZ91DRAFT_808114 [Kalaharituber pfeilii]
MLLSRRFDLTFDKRISANDRSLGSNVHLHDATPPEVASGDMIQNGSVTEANFLDILEIPFTTDLPVRVRQRGPGYLITRT